MNEFVIYAGWVLSTLYEFWWRSLSSCFSFSNISFGNTSNPSTLKKKSFSKTSTQAYRPVVPSTLKWNQNKWLAHNFLITPIFTHVNSFMPVLRYFLYVYILHNIHNIFLKTEKENDLFIYSCFWCFILSVHLHVNTPDLLKTKKGEKKRSILMCWQMLFDIYV